MGSASLPSQPLPDVQYNWVDVTDEFFEAVKGMIHSGNFNSYCMVVSIMLHYCLIYWMNIINCHCERLQQCSNCL